MQPGEHVEVEARERHYRVVGVLLVGDHEVTGRVPDETPVVEGAENGFHVGRSGGKERNVLDVRVVFGHVGDEVVNVVRRFPPADAKAAAEVGNEGANERVGDEVGGDAHMGRIVG